MPPTTCVDKLPERGARCISPVQYLCCAVISTPSFSKFRLFESFQFPCRSTPGCAGLARGRAAACCDCLRSEGTWWCVTAACLFSESVFQERGGGGAWNRQRSWRGSAASQKLGAAPGGDKQVSHLVSSRQRHLGLHENLSRAFPGLLGCERALLPAPWRRGWLASCSSRSGSACHLSRGPSPAHCGSGPSPTCSTCAAAPEPSRDSPGCLRDPGVDL